MKILFLLLLSFSVGASAEVSLSKLLSSVKQKKESLKVFRANLKCQPRDYDCFSREVLGMIQGHSEELVEAQGILVGFYQRSVKSGFPACDESCKQTQLASHMNLYLDYLNRYGELKQLPQSEPTAPTMNYVKIKSFLELNAFYRFNKSMEHLEDVFPRINFSLVTRTDLTNKKVLEEKYNVLKSRKFFSNSVLCRIDYGDPVYENIMTEYILSGKNSDEEMSGKLHEFKAIAQKDCESTLPFVYKGMDQGTRNLYKTERDSKIFTANFQCKERNFNCIRSVLRGLGLKYAGDILAVDAFLKSFMSKGAPKPCDETCVTQNLVVSIQNWITYLSTYDRSQLGYTMDWNLYPEEKYKTITEDVELYKNIQTSLAPLVTAYGKIDPAKVKDPALKSELQSVAKDLSEFASGSMLKDAVLCTMEPWVAGFDKYLSPYKDQGQNKKFEESVLEFKSKVCKH